MRLSDRFLSARATRKARNFFALAFVGGVIVAIGILIVTAIMQIG